VQDFKEFTPKCAQQLQLFMESRKYVRVLGLKLTIGNSRFYRAAWNATRSYDEISVRLSVRLSVCLSNACIVTKRKKAMFRFLYHMKDHLS